MTILADRAASSQLAHGGESVETGGYLQQEACQTVKRVSRLSAVTGPSEWVWR
jgi:hypothetical protein